MTRCFASGRLEFANPRVNDSEEKGYAIATCSQDPTPVWREICPGGVGIVLLLSFSTLPALAQPGAFTYQGRLSDNGAPANESNDLRFVLFDAPTNGNQISTNLTFEDVLIGNGLFTVTLDWGAEVFDGGGRWLEVRVRAGNAGGPFTTLAPRQPITATPYALHSGSASNLIGSVTEAQLPASASLLGPNIDSTEIVNGTIANADISAAANIADTKLAPITSAGKVANSATTATSANAPNSIVMRNAAGNFSAGTITGSFAGNGTGLSNITLSTISPAWVVAEVTNTFGPTFESGTIVPTGNSPLIVQVADLNGDNRLDFMVSGPNMGTQTLTNNDAGQYLQADVDGSAYDVALGDYNGDGRMDYVASSFSGTRILVWTNGGAGTFVLASQLTPSGPPSHIVSSHFNNDSYLDLAFSIPGTNTIIVLTNNGTGDFVAASTNVVAPGPGELVAGYVNADGRPDLVVIHPASGIAVVLLNSGGGIMTSNRSYAVGNGPADVVLADVNGDTRADFITANLQSHTLAIWTNNISSIFGFAMNVPSPSPDYVAAGDINADGRIDLVTMDSSTDKLRVLTNSPSGQFGEALAIIPGADPRSPGMADLNADGLPDLYLINAGNNAVMYWLQTLPLTHTANVQVDFSSANVTVSNNVSVGGFNVVAQTTATPTNNATLTPVSGYVKFANSGSVTLNAITAIAAGIAPGTTLILEGNSDANSVTIPNAANTSLGAARTLGLRDVLVLLWNGSSWLELSYANN